VRKLMPGHYLRVRRGQCDVYCYYTIPYDRQQAEANPLGYDQAKSQLSTLLEAAVQRRLVADVPLGTFLSGGIDSSVITALAARHKPDLHTFSIGFRDEKFFDETAYAKLVAGHLKTNHTVFSLTNDDLFAHVHNILDYIDEPFADSSAINVYILSRETRKHATVALSGDGADELMAGYNKHAALYRMQHPGWKEHAVSSLAPLWQALPQSRNSKLTNKVRQLARFSDSLRLSPQDRYWKLAGYASEDQATALLSTTAREQFMAQEYHARKKALLHCISDRENMNDILLTDTQLVLPNDMLTKVDLMSMAQGLEVRVPFLDVNVVNFLFSLPASYKINGSIRKKILQDAFRDVLPEALYNRPKKGFEVPLLKWLRQEMRSLITDDLLSEKRIREQGVFDYTAIDQLKRQLFSSNPGDAHARVWGLIVFQWWWKKHLKN